MRVMILIKATSESESGKIPSMELIAAMGKYTDELVKSGIMQDGYSLQPSSAGARVRFSGKDRTVIDGPFMDSQELIAGYWLWQVESMDEAIEWIKRCPNPMVSDSDIEIRPVFEPEVWVSGDDPKLGEKLRLGKDQALVLPRRVKTLRRFVGWMKYYEPSMDVVSSFGFDANRGSKTFRKLDLTIKDGKSSILTMVDVNTLCARANADFVLGILYEIETQHITDDEGDDESNLAKKVRDPWIKSFEKTFPV
jgi:hypothetical protein